MWMTRPRGRTARRSAFLGWCGIVSALVMTFALPPALHAQQRQPAIQLESGTLAAPQVAFVSDSASLAILTHPSGSSCARRIITGGVFAYLGTYVYGILFALMSSIPGPMDEDRTRKYFRRLKVVAIVTTTLVVLIEASGPACQSPPATR
jgi:hypothetical protein